MSSLLEENIPQRNASAVQPARPDTRSFGRTINGQQTDLVITKFANRDFIVLTQLRKLGTVVEITRDTVRNPAEGSSGRAVFSVNILLGTDNEEVHLFGRILAEKLGITKPILLTLGVKQLDKDITRSLIEFVAEKY